MATTQIIEIELHRAVIAKYICNMVRDAAEADDLVQETMIRALAQRATLRDDTALLSWLYRIATHVSLDRLRQRVRLQNRQDEQPPEELVLADRNHRSALTVVCQDEMSVCVQNHVAKLPDKYRAVLLLCDADGLTAREVAELLKLPLATVKMRLHRARHRLQTILQQACTIAADERGVLVCDPAPSGDRRDISAIADCLVHLSLTK